MRPINFAGTGSESGNPLQRADQFIPHVIVSDGLAALAFYTEVFGTKAGHNTMAPDGKQLMHGEVEPDGHKLFTSDEFAAAKQYFANKA